MIADSDDGVTPLPRVSGPPAHGCLGDRGKASRFRAGDVATRESVAVTCEFRPQAAVRIASNAEIEIDAGVSPLDDQRDLRVNHLAYESP